MSFTCVCRPTSWVGKIKGAETMPRAIWTGALSFGLVNVPVRLAGARRGSGRDRAGLWSARRGDAWLRKDCARAVRVAHEGVLGGNPPLRRCAPSPYDAFQRRDSPQERVGRCAAGRQSDLEGGPAKRP